MSGWNLILGGFRLLQYLQNEISICICCLHGVFLDIETHVDTAGLRFEIYLSTAVPICLCVSELCFCHAVFKCLTGYICLPGR